MAEPRDGPLPPSRTDRGSSQILSPSRAYSPWTLNDIRRRSLERFVGSSRGLSPPRNTITYSGGSRASSVKMETSEMTLLESRLGVFVVGSSGVGKRSLLSRLLPIDFEDSSDWTINTKYYTADVYVWISHISDDYSLPTLPQSHPLLALVLVFDQNELSTLVALKDWVSHTNINNFGWCFNRWKSLLTVDSFLNSLGLGKYSLAFKREEAVTCLKQFKELRSLCLKIISRVLEKYEDCGLASEFWDLFISVVNPLIMGFKQEGSSSEKPSSLFACFLSMSKNRNIVALLCREESLVQDIFSILTGTTTSEAIKKSLKYHGEREIKILKLLSKHIRDESHVMKYLDVLLTFLDERVKDSDIHHEALLAIQEITSLLRSESTSKIIDTVSPLLVDAEPDVRLCICDLLESLAKIDSSLDLVTKCASNMNATSPMEVDDLDYETIIDAYAKIDADFFNKFSEQHMMIILEAWPKDKLVIF